MIQIRTITINFHLSPSLLYSSLNWKENHSLSTLSWMYFCFWSLRAPRALEMLTNNSDRKLPLSDCLSWASRVSVTSFSLSKWWLLVKRPAFFWLSQPSLIQVLAFKTIRESLRAREFQHQSSIWLLDAEHRLLSAHSWRVLRAGRAEHSALT